MTVRMLRFAVVLSLVALAAGRLPEAVAGKSAPTLKLVATPDGQPLKAKGTAKERMLPTGAAGMTAKLKAKVPDGTQLDVYYKYSKLALEAFLLGSATMNHGKGEVTGEVFTPGVAAVLVLMDGATVIMENP